MKNIPFIDISNVNCWMIYLMPFDKSERTDYDRVNDLQQACIENKIFGMGWDIPCFEYGTPMTDENAAYYVEKYSGKGGTVSQNTIKDYKAIKKGDYVITRLKNGHFIVGKVSSEGAMFIYKEQYPIFGYFSWGGTVERWVDYPNDDAVPSEIVGRFSQRLHSTIQRIAPYRQRLLVISMYERTEEHPRFDIPKLRIGERNFVRSLKYMELEDLVALYITKQHAEDGYKLIPSSCKVSQQNYEFRFIAKDKNPITCQVKNQSEIEIRNYINETSYERIYIFSGKWNHETVLDKRAEYRDYKHIYIISPLDLYPVLREERLLSNDFYDYDSIPIRPEDIIRNGCLSGYTKQKKPNGDYTYSIDDGFICFVNGDGLFYSTEFESLIMSWDVFNGTEYDRNCIVRILNDLQGSGN